MKTKIKGAYDECSAGTINTYPYLLCTMQSILLVHFGMYTISYDPIGSISQSMMNLRSEISYKLRGDDNSIQIDRRCSTDRPLSPGRHCCMWMRVSICTESLFSLHRMYQGTPDNILGGLHTVPYRTRDLLHFRLCSFTQESVQSDLLSDASVSLGVM